MNFPEYMKAAILVAIGKPLVVDKVRLPIALEVGQVLVKISYSGICGSQLGEIDGAKGNDPYLPHLLGHEASGVVVDIGPGVRNVEKNNCVVLHWRKGIGIEAVPPVYRWGGKQLNAGQIATFGEYAIVSENRCTPISKNSNMKTAALFGCAVTTGFGVVENNAKVKIGESVLVFGAGGIGLNVIQASALAGAYPIIAIDVFENRLDLAKKMGATHLINSAKTNFEKEIRSIIDEDGLDVFIDNTGRPEFIRLGYEITKSQGRVVLVGVPKVAEKTCIHTLNLHFGKILIGSHGGSSYPTDDIPRYKNYLERSEGNLADLISGIYELDDINKAISDMRTGKASGRVLIKC